MMAVLMWLAFFVCCCYCRWVGNPNYIYMWPCLRMPCDWNSLWFTIMCHLMRNYERTFYGLFIFINFDEGQRISGRKGSRERARYCASKWKRPKPFEINSFRVLTVDDRASPLLYWTQVTCIFCVRIFNSPCNYTSWSIDSTPSI